MAYLVLSNGMTFEGRRIGAPRDRVGELVFTTGMEGYLETLTDPSFYGQIVTHSFPLIGNYGVIEEDFEGESALFGYVVRELCEHPSNFRSQYALDGQQYVSIDAAKEAGVGTLNYGNFIQNIINFLIIAFCVFLFVKFMTKLMPKKEAAPAKPARLCPYCKQPVHDEAVKCQHCGSDLK